MFHSNVPGRRSVERVAVKPNSHRSVPVPGCRANAGRSPSRGFVRGGLPATLGMLLTLVLFAVPAHGYDFLLCDADSGSNGGQNSAFDLAAKELLVRADGGFLAEHSSDATLVYELTSPTTIQADLGVGITVAGRLVGSLDTNTIYGDINVTVFLHDVTAGIELDQQVIFDRRQDGDPFTRVYEPVTSDPFAPPIALFENVLIESGHDYTVSVRAIARARGKVGEADFKDGDHKIDVGCLTVTPEQVDSDGDGLLDYWEIDGIDSNFDGVVDLQLPSWGAQWDHKDLFLELDWRTGQEPTRDDISALKQVFAQAPADAGGILNPDLSGGINLWVDTGGLMEDGLLVGDNFGGGNEILTPVFCLDESFYEAKADNFDPRRLPVFRYGILGISPGENQCADGRTPGGRAEIGGNDFISYSGDPGVVVHEFGHTLNLRHGGHENLNNKPNYISIMNYNYGLAIPQANGGNLVDFSPPRCTTCPGGRGAIPNLLDERELDETQVLDPNDTQNLFVFRDLQAIDKTWIMAGQDIDGDGSLEVDWDGDTTVAGGFVEVDINEDGKCVGPGDDGVIQSVPVNDDVILPDGLIHDGDARVCETIADPLDVQLDDPGDGQPDELESYDDWSEMVLPPLQFGESSDAALNVSEESERSIAEIIATARRNETTDLELIKTAPAKVNVDEAFVYNLQIVNHGPRMARRIEVIDFLPPQVTVLTLPEGCFQPGAEFTVICHPLPLLAGESHDLKIEVVVPAAAVAGLPAPVKIENIAHVENRVLLGLKGRYGVANDDPDPSNNQDHVSTVVNRYPQADGGLPYATECQGSRSDIQLDGAGSSDPDGDTLAYQWSTDCPGGLLDDGSSMSPKLNMLSQAPHPTLCNVTLTVTDDMGLSDQASVPVSVDDTTAPTLVVQLTPYVLTPADHTLRPIAATVTATDTCTASPTVQLSTIFADEPDDAPGPSDGNTTGDIADADLGTADFSFQLRAERLMDQDGRDYSVVYTAVDEKGIMTSVVERVHVPNP